jgi:hypothetical protein
VSEEVEDGAVVAVVFKSIDCPVCSPMEGSCCCCVHDNSGVREAKMSGVVAVVRGAGVTAVDSWVVPPSSSLSSLLRTVMEVVSEPSVVVAIMDQNFFGSSS